MINNQQVLVPVGARRIREMMQNRLENEAQKVMYNDISNYKAQACPFISFASIIMLCCQNDATPPPPHMPKDVVANYNKNHRLKQKLGKGMPFSPKDNNVSTAFGKGKASI